MVRYGFAVDDRDWVALAGVLTDDVVFDLRDHDVDPPVGYGPYVGVDEIIHNDRDVVTHPRQHMLVSHVYEDVSADEVVVRSKALFPMKDTIGDVLYRDVVVRTADGWRIKHKTVKVYR